MNPAIARDFAVKNFDAASSNQVHVAVLHVGADEKSQESLDLQCFANSGFDYVALGHIHKADLQTFGKTTVSYCGTPQGHDIGEPMRSGFSGEGIGYFANLVTIDSADGHNNISVQQISTLVAGFTKIKVDISGAENEIDVTRKIAQSISEEAQKSGCVDLFCRIYLTGETKMHNWLKLPQNKQKIKENLCSQNTYECEILVDTQMLYNEADLVNAGGVPAEIINTSNDMLKNPAKVQTVIQQFLNEKSKIYIDCEMIEKINIAEVVHDAQKIAISAVSPKIDEE